MIYYTIGALFTKDFSYVLLILKSKPEWQKGKFNFPGGKLEYGEDYHTCVAREFKEETDINTEPFDWKYIGIIEGEDYRCAYLTAIYDPEKHGQWQCMTDEKPFWCKVEEIIHQKVISNLYWLLPFAMNTWNPGNSDSLSFGTFTYKFKQ